MTRDFSNSNDWSLTLIRSGGYKIDNELNDALFLYGRNSREILMAKKNNIRQRLPNALIYLLKNTNLTDLALETGFIIDFSVKNKSRIFGHQWKRFEKIISSNRSADTPPNIHEFLWGVYSLDRGKQSFEMIEVTPERLPPNVWIRVRPLDDITLAWVISENNLLTSDDKEQKTLDDYFDFNLPELEKSVLTLPGPPN